MSIQSEITRLSDARAALDAAIAAKGVQVPGSARLGDLPALIAAIAAQKPEQSKTVSPALAQQVVTPDAGKTLSGVTVEALTKELLAALDENFKAENIKNGASILGLPGTFSPFGADAGISNYLIETFDYNDDPAVEGEKVMLRNELGWIPHLALHVLVNNTETGSIIVPNNNTVVAGFIDLRHWCPTYTKMMYYNFSLYNNGYDHAWWLPSVDMVNPANSWWTARNTENCCAVARFKAERYNLSNHSHWLRILLRFNEPTVTLTAPTGLVISDGESQTGDSVTGPGFTLAWNRSVITGGDDCVYLLYRDGALISTRVKDAGFTGTQANIMWSGISEADSGTYTVRAYSSYAGLSEPSNSVTFTYQANS